MKHLLMITAIAATTLAFVGCKKEKTVEEKAQDAVEAVGKAMDQVVKEAEKGAQDIQKKLDEALKK